MRHWLDWKRGPHGTLCARFGKYHLSVLGGTGMAVSQDSPDGNPDVFFTGADPERAVTQLELDFFDFLDFGDPRGRAECYRNMMKKLEACQETGLSLDVVQGVGLTLEAVSHLVHLHDAQETSLGRLAEDLRVISLLSPTSTRGDST